MLGIPRKPASHTYRTLARFMETTQKERFPVRVFRNGQRCCWRSIGVLIVLTLVMALHSGEIGGLSTALAKAEGGASRSGFPQLHIIGTSARASSSAVGTIMALLATLEEAGVLPLEGTAQANQVIHSVIQLQSAVMKSTSPEFAAYQVAVDRFWRNQHVESIAEEAKGQGLTARVLGAFIAYDQEHSLWEDPKLVFALQEFNVTRTDWEVVVDLFQQAEAVFRGQGRSLYDVYKEWQMKMPGGKS